MSVKYKINLAEKICTKILEEFKDDAIYFYLKDFQEKIDINYDSFGNESPVYDFNIIQYGNNLSDIDIKHTLYGICLDKLLQIAYDLGIEIPEYLPQIIEYKKVLKNISHEKIYTSFEEALKKVKVDPRVAVIFSMELFIDIVKFLSIKLEIVGDDWLNLNIEKIITNYEAVGKIHITDEIKTIIKTIDKISNNLKIEAFQFDSINAVLTINLISSVGSYLFSIFEKKDMESKDSNLKIKNQPLKTLNYDSIMPF